MANTPIGVDVSALLGMSDRVQGSANHFRDELVNLEHLVEETKNYMQGGPQTAFEEKYMQFKGSMTNFIGALEVYSAAMKEYAQNTSETVNVSTNRFNSI